MKLITNDEMEQIENVRKQLCESSYLHHSHQTTRLWRITHRKRNLKWLLNLIFKRRMI